LLFPIGVCGKEEVEEAPGGTSSIPVPSAKDSLHGGMSTARIIYTEAHLMEHTL
jgi:hypothetical protein